MSHPFNHDITKRLFMFCVLSLFSIVHVIAAPPVITAFSPASGPVGTSVTIIGSGFNTTAANNIIFFGAVMAHVTAASATSLIVTVPTGTSYQPISVLNDVTHLTGYSARPFITTFSDSNTITTGFFAPKMDFDIGPNIYQHALAVCDLDGDGQPDLVVTNGDGTISVLRNTSLSGRISFAAKVEFTIGTTPTNIAISDLDGDGKPDLVIANGGANTVSVLRNTSVSGSITATSFSGKVDFVTGASPSSIAIGDLDGDGKPDLVTSNAYSGTVSILHNTCVSGSINPTSFANAVDFYTGANPSSVAIGDLDGDGKPDLAIANNSVYQVDRFTQISTASFLHNTSISGSITFAAKVDFETGKSPISIAILNGSDLVTANGDNTVSLLRNNDASRVDFMIGTEPTSMATGDLNGDGKPDVVTTGGTLTVLRNIDNTSFAPSVAFDIGSVSSSIAICDLDGDGMPDLVTANYSAHTVSVLRNNSQYVPTPTTQATSLTFSGTTATTTTTSWTNGNGSSRAVFIAAVTTGSPVPDNAVTYDANPTYGSGTRIGATGWCCVYNGTGSSVTISGLTAGTTYRVMTVEYYGTVGHEQYLTSIAYRNPNNVTTLATNINAPPVITGFSPASGPVGTSVTITGSGFDATAVNNIVFFGATMAHVTTASTTSLIVTVPAGASYQPISVLNGFTHLTGYSAGPFITTFNNTNTITDFGPKVDFATGFYPSSLVITDLDGDGKADLVMPNFYDNTVSVLRNTGVSGSLNTASFAPKASFAAGPTPASVAIGDLDGDGKPDLVISNGDGISVLHNSSVSGSINNASFAAKVDFTIGSNSGATKLAIADLDGDGKPDLVIGSFYSNTVSVLHNTSVSGSINAASFEASLTISGGIIYPTSIAITDLDADGKPDLVIANYGTNTISVRRNTSVRGNITFATSVDFTTSTDPSIVAIGDLDGDGKTDLVIANRNANTVSVLQNTSVRGSVTFAAKVDFSTGTDPASVAIGDLDGDGKPDLVTSNESSETVSVLRNTSVVGSINAADFASRMDFIIGTVPASVVIGDLDGDGKPDLVTVNPNDNSFSVLRNNPRYVPTPTTQATNLTFSGTAATTTTASWTNGDGSSRAVFVAVASTGSPLPVNTITYTANTKFSSGTQIGATGWYCVYNGTGSSVNISGLTTGTTYRVMTVEYYGTTGHELYLTSTVSGNPNNVTTLSTNAALGSLKLSSGTLTPSFAGGTISYTASVSGATTGITVTPTTNDTTATVKVNGIIVTPGSASGSLPLSVGPNNITMIVTAQDGITTQTYTVIVTRDKESQTIAFSSLPALSYGSADFSPGATVSSGLPVSYSSSNTLVATIVNDKIHIIGTGNSTIIASQSGNSTYIAAPDASQLLTVNTAPLTITANNQSRVYGQANPALTVFYSGFVNGDTEADLTTAVTATTTATDSSAIGIYTITPAGAVNSNYTISYVNGTFNIVPATRTLTFKPIGAKTYGDPDFNGSATVSSGDDIIYSGYNPAVITIVNGKIHIAGAGTTAITATVAANSNYSNIPSSSQTLVVNKAPQAINFAAIPKLDKGAKYDLSIVTASSGLPVTFISVDPTIANINGQTLNALRLGKTIITASQAGDANYFAAQYVRQEVVVKDDAGDDILVHQAVSPNGDGINDFLYIEGIKDYPQNEVSLVNRNGVEIFQEFNYNNGNHVFDGHSNITGALQQAGTYFYKVEFIVNGERKSKTGYIVLKY